MLSVTQHRLWDEYQQAEDRTSRPGKLRALQAFLDALDAATESEWFPWARSIAEKAVDQHAPLTIRQSLFEQAIFPALLAGYRARQPGCARWLAGLYVHLVRSQACREQLPPEESSQQALLRAAIRDDPADHRSIVRLIENLAAGLRYSLHELPAGVLYDGHGASPQQCRELEKELDELRRLVAQEHVEQQYSELIRVCHFHFRAYSDYCLHREQFSDYAGYLAEMGDFGADLDE